MSQPYNPQMHSLKFKYQSGNISKEGVLNELIRRSNSLINQNRDEIFNSNVNYN